MSWVREHSLGAAVTLVTAVSLAWSLAVGAEAKDIAVGVFGDAFGAWFIVFATKYGQERGRNPSAESK